MGRVLYYHKEPNWPSIRAASKAKRDARIEAIEIAFKQAKLPDPHGTRAAAYSLLMVLEEMIREAKND